MDRNWDRLAPLTGIVFVVLVAGGAVASGSTPGSDASGQAVISYYEAHRGRERLAAVLLTLAIVALLLFAAVLRTHLRRQGRDGLAAALLAGASVYSVGVTLGTSITWTLVDAPAKLSRAGAQTLNLASNDLVLVTTAGWIVLSLCAAIAILAGVGLPRWLGWWSLVIALLVVTPLEFAAFILFVAWILVTAVAVLRTGVPAATPRSEVGITPARG